MLRNSTFLLSRLITGFLVLVMVVACSSLSEPDRPSTLEPTSPPTSMPTSTSLPTYIEYQLPLEDFSLDNANTIPPEDIISEVYYEGAGGGGGRQFDCTGVPSSGPIASPYRNKNVQDKFDLLMPLQLIVCGWMQDEKIELKVTSPKGETITTFLVSQPGIAYLPEEQTFYGSTIYYSEYIYYPSIDSLAGKYIFIFTGANGDKVEYVIDYVEPVLPIAYIIDYRAFEGVNNTNIDFSLLKDKFPFIVLSGYLPNEQVRLFLYQGGNFQAWRGYTVNESGRLSIEFIDFQGEIIMVGDVSNVEIHLRVYPNSFVFYVDRLAPIYLTCKDTIPTRLKLGEYAEVSSSPRSNRLRSEPTTSASLLDMLAPETLMQIIDGPECADGILWWKVKGVNRDFEGWTGEGDTTYWLIPCSSKKDC